MNERLTGYPADQRSEPEANKRRDALVERLFGSAIGAMELVTVHIGGRLGLYRALADLGTAHPGELAARTGVDERYAREWLEQQAVAGILEVEAWDAAPPERRYLLPAGHAEALLDRNSLGYITPLALQIVGCVRPLDGLLAAFRDGGGVPYEDYGPDMREGISGANRALFVNLLGKEWLPAVPDVDARLRSNLPARVADIGCGTGWSSIAIAIAYPEARVDGFDLDEASVATATANAEAEGLADSVRFKGSRYHSGNFVR